ncbi:Peptidoglycan synthase FtsI precursor [Piscirickettsia salmonis]|uniref:peptidoglycan D,D-transpeptidase FtsI family protein n=1 Tax=Piscirickettsia salmonis TaxID=1238 RepID=UPI0012BA6178|nr:penicillin-binding protein 2 [Piscirickettsia salmonis]QGP54297.1 Peptidoglycan synthase FtsI precursor [Piscirickettsia salmonis]QGP59806.1 Peptidoglycan synthase FtsI precursor [Piscirickettsia salmonis]QGP64507.1 Peptidoglycan synthase FtsI precursor [Piscirickettsia salmonis]
MTLRGRFWVLISLLFCIVIAVAVRLVYLQSINRPFLEKAWQTQSTRFINVNAYRGMILDRDGIPLAVSSLVNSIVLDPVTLLKNPIAVRQIAKLAPGNISKDELWRVLRSHQSLRYWFWQRDLPPFMVKDILVARVAGVYIVPSFKRFYPQGACVAQIVGFTGFSGEGRDGIELQHNRLLMDKEGKEKVRVNGKGQIIQKLDQLKAPHSGEDVQLSIDIRLQTEAYKALERAVEDNKAESGTVVLVNVRTGEVLAMVSVPSFNPNDLSDRVSSGVRARALTDVFEPGSTVKPLIMSMALDSKRYTPTTPIDTSPGWYYIQHHRVRDDANFGQLTTTGVLKKSSNVGISRIALSFPPENIYKTYSDFGLGQMTGVKFPGQRMGYVPTMSNTPSPFVWATMTFGYALTATPLQIVRAYAAIANQGIELPMSLLKREKAPIGYRVIKETTAKAILAMLHTVVEPGGTGILANVPNYQVAGKTGTAHKVGPNGFYKNKFDAFFAGIAPLNDPQFAAVVFIDNPQKGHFSKYGGVSAAPVFSRVMSKALQLYNVRPFGGKQVEQWKHMTRAQLERLVAIA